MFGELNLSEEVLKLLNQIAVKGAYIFVAIAFFIVIQRITASLINSSKQKLEGRPGISGISVSFWLSFLYYVIVIVAFLGALRIAGISYTSILAGVSITGLIVGLATQNILSNLFAGMMILAQKPFDIGDSVTVGNYTGTVKAINVLTTTIETLERLEITMPNKIDPIDYYADKGIISDKPKEGEKDPRDSISDFTKKGGPEDENPVKENKKTMPEDVPSKMV